MLAPNTIAVPLITFQYSAEDWFNRAISTVTTSFESGISPRVESLVYSKLDATAWQRFRNFSQWPDGWAGEGSLSLSAVSLANFERFLESSRFATARSKPSLFMTDDGLLEIGWESSDNTAIHVTFTTKGASFYIEATGEEGNISTDGIGNLAERLTSLCR